ncbi:MAG TPA: GAF domain-containing protein, partial [Stellaceae bacterium]|nr:GAF domain-containing protein [Stellaceae bacterium]
MREALAPLYAAAERDLALLLLGLLLASLAALLLARRMVVPIRAIADGAARLGQGELDRRIEVKTGDELEALAGEFNQMAGQLQKSYAELEQKVEARTAELSEALEQQTATAEVLGVINSSPGDLAPVFEAMLEKALALCGAAFGIMLTYDGQRFHHAAVRGVPDAFAEHRRRNPSMTFPPQSNVGRHLHGEDVVQILDLEADDTTRGTDQGRALLDLGGARTLLSAALRKDGFLLGILSIYRQEVRPFTDKQIALLENFAAQAVIAMENARLIAETREALEQQTATAEVLGVINSSPGDLAPVFDAILEKAHTLCGAAKGSLVTFDGERFQAVSTRGLSKRYATILQGTEHNPPGSPPDRLVRGERLVQIPDIRALEFPVARAVAELEGARTILYIPLRRDSALLGYITAYRQEVRPFTDKQIALLQNFAAQAVIAMENARLITETREALEQQTATAEVLGVINSSPGDLAPVFDAILEKAHTLCGATYGNLAVKDGEDFRSVAFHNYPQAFIERSQQRFRISEHPVTRHLADGAPFVHIPDIAEVDHPVAQAAAEGGFRTCLFIPLRGDNAFLGYIVASRQEVRPFTDKQIALLQNFAAQAVIAMESARLITETREALEQQTATAEVLQVINSSPGDLAPVFDAMLEKAIRLCEAEFGIMFAIDGESARMVAERDVPEQLTGFLTRHPPGIGSDTFFGRAVIERSFLHTADVRAEAGYRDGQELAVTAADLAGVRALLMAPLLKDDGVLGVFAIFRREIRPFTEKQIALLQNFAAQAVIAMENARLITETREALEQQTATAEVLQVINSSPGDLAPVFDAMLEKAMRLCEAALGSLMTYDGECFNMAAARNLPPALIEQTTRVKVAPGGSYSALVGGERLVHTADIRDTEFYRSGAPSRRALADLGGARTAVWVALRKDDALLGSFVLYRQEVRPFSDKQIALLQNFAAQAVIAMENARLITETREALEQQTATAEVLGVINSSPGELQPVFQAMVDKAARLCDAVYGGLRTFDGGHFPLAAMTGDASFVELARRDSGKDSAMFEAFRGGERVVNIADVREAAVYRTDAALRKRLDVGNVRSWLGVALEKEGGLAGVLVVYRQEVRPFSDKQIALLQNFAAQAVIAMENARLIIETREALDQQTATAEVLQVINSSPGDLAPVFEAMLDKAMRLCEARQAHLFTFDGELVHPVAVRGNPQFGEWLRQQGPTRSPPGSSVDRLRLGEAFVHMLDPTKEEPYRTNPWFRELIDRAGCRTTISVPLRKDDTLVGTIHLYRQEVRPFSDKQIALLQNFAAQAVIAMENARLITETREALEQQTATAEVLQVINSSPGDLAPVFDAMLGKALRLCDGAFGNLLSYDGKLFHIAAAVHGDGQLAEQQRRRPPFAPSGKHNVLAPILRGDQVVFVEDVLATDNYLEDGIFKQLVVGGGYRSLLNVALRKEGALVGVIGIFRKEVRPFSDKQIALLQNFAAQAVIAMENARLITETREALEQQTATAEVLQVINSSPGDLTPVFDAILDKAHSLCGATMGGLLVHDGENFRAVATHNLPGPLAEKLRQGYRGVDSPVSRPLLDGARFFQAPDLQDLDHPIAQAGAALGVRTLLTVPLRRDDAVLGLIVAVRQEVRPFTDKQIALLQNFAAQAVIAMENARLITETREALEQQTATAEVLGVINSSPGDLAPVFDAILEKAHSLCGAILGGLWTYDGERFRAVATRGYPENMVEMIRRPIRGTAFHQGMVRGGRYVHIPDVLAEVSELDDPVVKASIEAGNRTFLAVPLRKDGTLLGHISAARPEVRPFSEKEIALLDSFAAQ